ncbi:MAG TPA: DUF547 domain-containing protein [Vicinamibacterales bacterium]|jgi:hypothetical protein|nr:DUF547 domain-containing protein [Vicinamibacterales bacterium]
MRHTVLTTFAAAAVALLAASAPRAQENANARRGFDTLLDMDVRDGLVYYRALKSDRGRLDSFVASLASASIDSASRDEQIAFWINAYNAIVLRTVVDHYPIAGRAGQYPPNSIRQIPGAFERTTHRVAGKSLTLDQIEQTALAGFNDPRVFLALGRGAMGSGRLRSEAYSGANLQQQLTEAADECVTRASCAQFDRAAGKLRVSSVFSWRQREFAAAYADKAASAFASRSPIERAIVAIISPKLVSVEKEALEKNQFVVEFLPFDWSLNDLTGRSGGGR